MGRGHSKLAWTSNNALHERTNALLSTEVKALTTIQSSNPVHSPLRLAVIPNTLLHGNLLTLYLEL